MRSAAWRRDLATTQLRYVESANQSLWDKLRSDIVSNQSLIQISIDGTCRGVEYGGPYYLACLIVLWFSWDCTAGDRREDDPNSPSGHRDVSRAAWQG